MIDLNLTLFGLLAILALNIFVFIYSAISTDMITTFISLTLFLIFLLPFYVLLEKLKLIILLKNSEDLIFYKIFSFYSTLLNLFIGFFLIVQLIYLLLTS